MEKTLVQIGSSKETVVEARKSILDILQTNNDQDTKRIALQAFERVCSSNKNSFSNCSFIGSPSPNMSKRKRRHNKK